MTDRPMLRHAARHRLTAALVGAVLALSACGDDADDPPEGGKVEVQGGAVGPDVRINDDLGLQQVQLAYPPDGVYEEGGNARLFMAITNTGTDPVTLTDISGPDFSGVRVDRTDGEGLPLVVGSDQNLYLGAAGPPNVTLLDLHRSLRSSQSIPVTFTFAEAGEATVEVMVSAEEDDRPVPFDFPNEDPEVRPEEQPSTSPAAPTS